MMTNVPSEEELHAYVDGRLDDARRQAIEFYLTQHPQRANEVRAWQRDAQQLRAAFGGFPTEVAAPSLDPTVLRARRRTRRRALAIAAMLIISIGLGGIGGWQARSYSSAGREPPMADAMQAYRLFAQQHGNGPLDVTEQHRGDLQAWLGTHFSHAPTLPDLQAAGFHPVGGRLLALSEGAAAMVLYENAQGNAISFYIRPPSRFGELPRGQRQDGGLMAVYGAGNGYNIAMVSRSDKHDVSVSRLALESTI